MIVTYDVKFDEKRDALASQMLKEKPNMGMELAQYLARQELLKRSKPESQLFDEAWQAYKHWTSRPDSNWSGNSPNPWESFFAGYKAALGK